MLEEVFRDGLTALAKHTPGAPLDDPRLFQPLLQLWDGVCHLYSGRAKPQAWVALLLRLGKLFSPEARGAAAQAAAPALTSGPMRKVQGLWRELKPLETLRQQFEAADVEGGGGGGSERSAKRRRA